MLFWACLWFYFEDNEIALLEIANFYFASHLCKYNICTRPGSLFLKYLYLFLMIAGDIVVLWDSAQRPSMSPLTQLAMGISTSDWISIQTDIRIQNFYKLQFSDLLTYYWTLWSEVRSLSKVVKSCHRTDNRVRGPSPPSDLCCHSWG